MVRTGLERHVDRRAACAALPPPRGRRPRRAGRPSARASPRRRSRRRRRRRPRRRSGSGGSFRGRARRARARVRGTEHPWRGSYGSRPVRCPRAPSPCPRPHVEPRAHLARRAAPARLRVRGAVVNSTSRSRSTRPTRSSFRPASVVLKLNAPSHTEADTRPTPSTLGRPAERYSCIARDDARRALLIERCVPGTRARGMPDVDEIAVVAELLPRLQLGIGGTHAFALRCRRGGQVGRGRPAR